MEDNFRQYKDMIEALKSKQKQKVKFNEEGGHREFAKKKSRS